MHYYYYYYYYYYYCYLLCSINEIENMDRVTLELQKHELKFGRMRNAGEHEPQETVPQLFGVLKNFQSCLYKSKETRRTCFLFLLENTLTKKTKQLVIFNY